MALRNQSPSLQVLRVQVPVLQSTGGAGTFDAGAFDFNAFDTDGGVPPSLHQLRTDPPILSV